MSIVVRAQAMLSLNQVRPFLTADQKRLLKAAIAMCGHIMWDNDFVPWINWQYNFSSARQTCRSNMVR